MSKPIILTHEQWFKLKNRLTNDYSPSVIMLSYRMKDKLGFTIREYQVWRENGAKWDAISDIRLDFYSEPKRTMFLLKYGEYLDDSNRSSI